VTERVPLASLPAPVVLPQGFAHRLVFAPWSESLTLAAMLVLARAFLV
jgi:hypothetical protein